MKKTFLILSGSVLTLILVFAFVTWMFMSWMEQALGIEDGTIFRIEDGQTLTSVASSLKQKHQLDWSRFWVVYAKLSDRTNIKKGEYLLDSSDTPMSLLEKFIRGDVVLHRLVLVEGKRFNDYLAVLATNDKLDHQLAEKSMAEIMQALELDIAHPEGWFLPETYTFVEGQSDIEILRLAHKKMRRTLDELWEKRDAMLPYESPYEALIMASIVEKETGVDYERAEIAGVFVRRLNKGMKLQTDPTVIYGMGDNYQGNIRRKDLRTATPYNTYIIDGLPPTPIAMPGREAIEAALNPLDGSSLYFVAKGDGSHHFSATYDEHREAVKKYQLTRSKNYRSAPPATK